MSLIADVLAQEGVAVDKTALKKLLLFCELLRKWNKTHSFTTLQTDEEYAQAILDSLYPLTFLEPFDSCLDIGSGAGFPALALAIARPFARFCLCEPLSKKYGFLQFVKIELELDNVTVKKNRVEELGGETFELITSRAVADAGVLTALSDRLLKQDGRWLFYKGERSDVEAKTLNARVFVKNKRRYLLIRKEIC